MHSVRGGVLPASPRRAVSGSAGHHRSLASQRSGELDVRRGVGHGCRLRPRMVARPRPPAVLPDAVRAPPTAKGDGMSEPVRVAVVGLGYWGPNLVRNLAELDAAELVVV